MSVWTRIKKALAALAKGEPLSAVFSRLRTPPERSAAFAIAVIALGAKMAKADGRVTIAEVAAFRRVFTIAPEDEASAARVYDMARTEVAGFEAYARQIARMFHDRPQALADLLEGLVHIAAADGAYHPDEAAFLDEVARIFAVPEAEFRAIRARQLPGEHDPWAVLGLRPGSGPEALRERYRALVRAFHPDGLISRGIPAEARRLAEHRLAAVNAAYAEIRAELARA